MAKKHEPAAEPALPGIYQVQMVGVGPRKLVDTGILAGPAAETIAKDRYLDSIGLRMRPGLPPIEIQLESA